MARAGWVNGERERSVASKFFDAMRVKAGSLDAPTAGLSGGNQQKLVMARWLAADCTVLMVDEPTRGVDVGAKAEIHGLIEDLAEKGGAVLMVSSDLPEVIHLSSRVLVMRAGKVAGELGRGEATQESVMRLMGGIGAVGRT
jgi:ABC-type sugar transport system ATPase subunit